MLVELKVGMTRQRLSSQQSDFTGGLLIMLTALCFTGVPDSLDGI